MSALEELREQIDETDNQIVSLLNRRAELVLEVRKTKRKEKISVYSPGRERQILDRVKSLASNGAFPEGALERIFVNIISVTRSLIGDVSVAYLGPECSFEHEAAVRQFGEEVRYSPEVNVEDVFSRVERGDVHYGVIPTQVNPTGIATKVLDLLMESDLRIIAEIENKEKLALLSKNSGETELLRVLSRAYYFSRSEAWVGTNLPSVELLLEDDIGRAVTLVEADDSCALIGPEMMADHYGLQIVESGIQSDLITDPRYVVLGQKIPAATGHDKTSLVCSVRDRSGALRDILQPFSERGVTLLKIESHPVRKRAGECVFFIHLVGHQSDSIIAETISDLAKLSNHTKVLGSYPLVCTS